MLFQQHRRHIETAVLSDFELIRGLLQNGTSFKLPAVVEFIKNHGAHQSVKIFLEGLGHNDFGVVREFVKQESPTLIISKFGAFYHKQLSYDGLIVEYVELPKRVTDLFPSNARPVRVIAQTSGFSSPRSVALFPENFATIHKVSNDAAVYYFINKFVVRFKTRTRPFIASGRVNKESFLDIMSSNDDSLLAIASSWVLMHEHFHTQGLLPLPGSLPQKSSRSSAAVEELRVDLLTILHSLDRFGSHRGSMGTLIAQFVLAERLIRYPIDAHPNDDYDSRSSLLLAHLLRKENAISWNNGLLNICSENLIPALRKVLAEIQKVEAGIEGRGHEEQKKCLENFVLTHSPTDSAGRFLNISPFEDFHECF